MGETTGGVGGRARANKIDQYVTDAVTGTVSSYDHGRWP
jgi:hypothetical protein